MREILSLLLEPVDDRSTTNTFTYLIDSIEDIDNLELMIYYMSNDQRKKALFLINFEKTMEIIDDIIYDLPNDLPDNLPSLLQCLVCLTINTYHYICRRPKFLLIMPRLHKDK